MIVALLARLLLAGVFLVAGVAKLADRSGTRRAVVAFGAPPWSASALALAVPLAELAAGALLLPASTAALGATCALVLLALFSAAIAWSAAHGRAPDCHCFGQLHSAPAGWPTLLRNAALAAVGVVALVGSLAAEPASALTWIGGLDRTELIGLAVGAAVLVLVAVGGATFLTLMRSYGTVLVRLERVERALHEAGIELPAEDDLPPVGLEPGTEAPWFLTSDTAGAGVSRDDLLVEGRSLLLLFTSPGCGPCVALLPQAGAWQRDYADVLTIAFASSGSAETTRAEAEEHALEHVLVDESGRLAAAFRASGTPSAVLVAPGGTIASWVAVGSEAIAALVHRVTEGGDGGQGLPLGTEAPALELPALSGELVTLPSLRGHDTLLLFWNPGCGFCRSMRDDLLAWEASANGVTPKLVIVSSGDRESTGAEGFRSLVLLDQDNAAGTAFGAHGTPMAVLVDADGRIGSPVAAGAHEVLALAGRTNR